MLGLLAFELNCPELLNKNIKVAESMKIMESMKIYGSSQDYQSCLEKARKKNLKLCPEGYCTAKEKFEVYPSAYANAYAAQVCKGSKPDMEGNLIDHYQGKEKDPDSGLSRWFKEEWVNVCETDNKGGYKPCGRSKAKLDPENYPYCRPLNKLKGTTVKTVNELSKEELEDMCEEKRSLEQGIDKKPTRVFINK